MSSLSAMLFAHFESIFSKNDKTIIEKHSLLKIHVSVFGMVVAILHDRVPPHGCPFLFPQGYYPSFLHELFGLAGHAASVPLSFLRNPASCLPKFEDVMHRWHCVTANLPVPSMPLLNKLHGKHGSAWQRSSPLQFLSLTSSSSTVTSPPSLPEPGQPHVEGCSPLYTLFVPGREVRVRSG
jgi:hypothetical protein